MARLESLPGEEQPLQDADVVSWELGRRSRHTTRAVQHQEGGLFERRFLGVALRPRLPRARPAGRCRERSALGSHQDIGISDSFIRDVRDKITPGTSALFIFASDHAALDRAADEFRDTDAEIIRTNLSKEHEARPREAFAQD
jgi:uncharacterized membrane protein